MWKAKRAGKQIAGGIAVLALMALGSCASSGLGVAAAQGYLGGGYVGVGVDMGVFHEALNPYGDWVFVSPVGRAWRPYRTIVGLDFRPYLTAGHWVYTDYGWSFESDYDWGWAPFHYGRWFMDSYYGWVWVPDTVWAPAWVDWRFGGGYVGWAPLAPVGLSVSLGFYPPVWCFVPTVHFVVRDVYHYALPVERFHAAFGVTSPIVQEVVYSGARWNGGPPPGQISHAAGLPIQAVHITPPRPGMVQAMPNVGHGVPPPPGAAAGNAYGRSEPHWGGPPVAPPSSQPHWGGPPAPPSTQPRWGPPPAPPRMEMHSGGYPQQAMHAAPPVNVPPPVHVPSGGGGSAPQPHWGGAMGAPHVNAPPPPVHVQSGGGGSAPQPHWGGAMGAPPPPGRPHH